MDAPSSRAPLQRKRRRKSPSCGSTSICGCKRASRARRWSLTRWRRSFSTSLDEPLLSRHRGSRPTRRTEFLQTRQHLLGEQGDVGDGIGMVEKTALAEHQQIAEAADTVMQRLDLVVHVVGRAGEAGAALNELLDRRCPLVDRIAMAVAHKAAALAA